MFRFPYMIEAAENFGPILIILWNIACVITSLTPLCIIIVKLIRKSRGLNLSRSAFQASLALAILVAILIAIRMWVGFGHWLFILLSLAFIPQILDNANHNRRPLFSSPFCYLLPVRFLFIVTIIITQV